MPRLLPSGARLDSPVAADAWGDTWVGVTAAGAPLRATVLAPGLAADAGVQARLRRERPVLLGLASRHLVRWTDVVTEAGLTVLGFQEPAGENLQTLLARAGPPPSAVAARVAAQVCFGLTAAHAAGLVHGSLRADVVWVEVAAPPPAGDPLVRVAGIGLAALLRPALLSGGPLSGGPLSGGPQDAPELADGRALTPAADLWSVGLLLAGLTGGTPGSDGPGEAPAGVPAALWDEVLRLTAADPAARPVSARAAATRLVSLADALDGALTRRTAADEPVGPAAPSTRVPLPALPRSAAAPAGVAAQPSAAPSAAPSADLGPGLRRVPRPQSAVAPLAPLAPLPPVVPVAPVVAPAPAETARATAGSGVPRHLVTSRGPRRAIDGSRGRRSAIVGALLGLAAFGAGVVVVLSRSPRPSRPTPSPAAIVGRVPTPPPVVATSPSGPVSSTTATATDTPAAAASTPVAAASTPVATPPPTPASTTRPTGPSDDAAASAAGLRRTDLGASALRLERPRGSDFNTLLRALYAYCDYYTPTSARRSGHAFLAYRFAGVEVYDDVAVYPDGGAAGLLAGLRTSLQRCPTLSAHDATGRVQGTFALIPSAPLPGVPHEQVALTYQRVDAAGPTTRAVFLRRGRTVSVVLVVGQAQRLAPPLGRAVQRASSRLAGAPAT